MADKRSFLLRLPDDLYAELKRWSEDELRSINGQIEYLLRDALRRRRRAADESGGPIARGADPARNEAQNR